MKTMTESTHTDGGRLWTAQELAEELSSWYVHVTKGRDALRELAAEEEVDPDALFSAAVKLWDKEDVRSFRYRTPQAEAGDRVRVSGKGEGLVLEVSGPKAVRAAEVALDNGVTVFEPIGSLGQSGTVGTQMGMFE